MIISLEFKGGSGISIGGGGGANNYVRVHDMTSLLYGRGPGPCRLRALEALGGFYALPCYLSLIFKHSDTNGIQKT